jgi:penicillin-binding protein 2
MKQDQLSLASRERIALMALAGIVLLLMGGLIKLQVFEHAELMAQSESNRLRIVPITPRRGRVYDREQRLIINDRPSYTLSLVPIEEVRNVTVPNLARLIGLDTAEVRRRIRKTMGTMYQPAPIMKDIPFEIVAVLEEQYEKFPGVSYQLDRVRKYTDSIGSEAYTGYVGEVSRDQLENKGDQDLRLGSMVGKKGIEKQYDRELRGREGTEYIEVFATGQVLGPTEERPQIDAIPGSDLVLSIDLDLQHACSAILDTFYCGAMVAMDPRTGEILAMTSYPGFDANIFSSVIPDSLWTAISSDVMHPLLNRPITGLYPPGSTAKLVTVGTGLEERLITPNSTFMGCSGGYRVGNRVFHCWEPRGHGVLTAAHAIEQSCDIFMYQLGLKEGVDVLGRYYALCGFGRPTGVDMPGEAPGLAPDAAYYDRHFGKGKWTKALVCNNAIGQGEVLVTPLQLAQFFCGLANKGVVYKPHLVKEIRHPDGEVETITPEVSFHLPFSPATMDVLTEGLTLVVQGSRGTAQRLRNRLYTVGGKTGTAQNPHGNDHSLFVGIAPMEAPEIVVCAIIENAGHGSTVAAPAAGEIIKVYMEKRMAARGVAMTDGEAPK